MNEVKFELGDMVKHRSHPLSPVMVIYEYVEFADNYVICQYYDEVKQGFSQVRCHVKELVKIGQ